MVDERLARFIHSKPKLNNMATKCFIMTIICLLIAFNLMNCQKLVLENIKREYFNKINENFRKFHKSQAEIAWTASVNPDSKGLEEKAVRLETLKTKWLTDSCQTLDRFRLNSMERRMKYILCRDLRYDPINARKISKIIQEMQSIYSDAEICLPKQKANSTNIQERVIQYIDILKNLNPTNYMKIAVKSACEYENDGSTTFCMKIEPHLAELMAESRNEEVLRWAWLVWREKVAPMKNVYGEMINVSNMVARKNDFKDLGSVWRDELEIRNLREFVMHLYDCVKPLYIAIHGIIRYVLRRHYGDEVIKQNGGIPAHLLGNMWGYSWDKLIDLIIPNYVNVDLSRRFQQKNWSAIDIVLRSEDFYTSLGLPAMPRSFWNNSMLIDSYGNTSFRCHGSAANMYKTDDYRLIFCKSGDTLQDMYIVVHEMGHVQYYMAYKNQPYIFQDGTNSAFHESIGDAMMYGLITQQNLYRLGIINDTDLINKYKPDYDTENPDDYLIVSQLKTKRNFQNNDFLIRERYKKYFSIKRNMKSSKFDSELNSDVRKLNNHKFPNEDHLNELLTIKDKHENDYQSESDTKYKTDFDTKSYIEIEENLNNNFKSESLHDYDTNDFNLRFDEAILLRMFLNKMPNIPYGLTLDMYRWYLFEKGNMLDSNTIYWDFVYKLQGITPPIGEPRGENYFDAGANYHVADNTPYIRYYLASYIQLDLFKKMCKAEQTPVELNKCDIYGSKEAGRFIQRFMEKGASLHWSELIHDINADSLIEYYKPLYKYLNYLINKYDIPLGW